MVENVKKLLHVKYLVHNISTQELLVIIIIVVVDDFIRKIFCAW